MFTDHRAAQIPVNKSITDILVTVYGVRKSNHVRKYRTIPCMFTKWLCIDLKPPTNALFCDGTCYRISVSNDLVTTQAETSKKIHSYTSISAKFDF